MENFDDDYLRGCDILGAAATGYSSSTIADVQRALLAKGISVGPKGVDGKMGPDTASAIMAFWNTQGLSHESIIDQDLLSALGVTPSATPALKVPAIVSTVRNWVSPPSGPPAGVPAVPGVPGLDAAASPVSFWQKPLVGPVKVWHGALGGTAALALGLGLFRRRG